MMEITISQNLVGLSVMMEITISQNLVGLSVMMVAIRFWY